MNLNMLRIRSVIRKEMRDYRRNRFIFASMAIYPVIFIALPMANIFAIPASVTTAALRSGWAHRSCSCFWYPSSCPPPSRPTPSWASVSRSA